MDIVQLVISIGNTDNKLTQQDWSVFVKSVDESLASCKVWFRGFSNPDAPRQNACWWVETTRDRVYFIRNNLRMDRDKFGQDSIVMLECNETEFI